VAVSDLAAMGATAIGFTLALTLPDVGPDWLSALPTASPHGPALPHEPDWWRHHSRPVEHHRDRVRPRAGRPGLAPQRRGRATCCVSAVRWARLPVPLPLVSARPGAGWQAELRWPTTGRQCPAHPWRTAAWPGHSGTGYLRRVARRLWAYRQGVRRCAGGEPGAVPVSPALKPPRS
jgi:hypothetical protein